MSVSKNKSSISKGYLALFITCIVWGTTWVASKIGVNEIPALQLAYIRQFIAGVCFVGYFMLVKKMPLPSAKQFLWIIILALLMFASANGLSTWSLKYIPTGLSALIGALYPLSVVIIERIFFKAERLNRLTVIGLLLGIVGIGIVFYESAFQSMNKSFLFGLVLSIIAMLSWSVGTVVITKSKTKMNPYYATGWQMLGGSFLLFLFAHFTQPTIPVAEISTKVWIAILYLVSFGSIVSFIAFIYSMKVLPMALASLYAYINPLVAMLLAAVLLNEKLTANILWGSLVTLSGVYLVNYSIKRNAKAIVEPEQ